MAEHAFQAAEVLTAAGGAVFKRTPGGRLAGAGRRLGPLLLRELARDVRRRGVLVTLGLCLLFL